MSNWLESLKVGDKALDGDNLLTVTAIHKLYIVCGGTKYKKSTGQEAGKPLGFYPRYIREATPEAIAEVTDKQLRGKLLFKIIRGTNYRALATKTLQRIVYLLDAEKNEEPGVGR